MFLLSLYFKKIEEVIALENRPGFLDHPMQAYLTDSRIAIRYEGYYMTEKSNSEQRIVECNCCIALNVSFLTFFFNAFTDVYVCYNSVRQNTYARALAERVFYNFQRNQSAMACLTPTCQHCRNGRLIALYCTVCRPVVYN